MFDFNVGELETIFDGGSHKIMEQDGLLMIYSNDQMYFLKSSIYTILNHLNKEYIDNWIDEGFKLKTIKNRINEIEKPFDRILKRCYGDDLLLFNADDVECVINGCENWLNIVEGINGSIQVNFG